MKVWVHKAVRLQNRFFKRVLLSALLVSLCAALCGCAGEGTADVKQTMLSLYGENREITGDYDASLAAKCSNGVFVASFLQATVRIRIDAIGTLHSCGNGKVDYRCAWSPDHSEGRTMGFRHNGAAQVIYGDGHLVTTPEKSAPDYTYCNKKWDGPTWRPRPASQY